MILYIDTTINNQIILELKKDQDVVLRKKFPAPRKQAEKLLPQVKKLLDKNNFTLGDISELRVNNDGGSFTALRIGVVTANALAYALGVKIEGKTKESCKIFNNIRVVNPVYNTDPQITVKKKGLV